MATSKKRAAQVPGAPTAEGAAEGDEPEVAEAPETKSKAPKLEPTSMLHPAIREAVAGAEKMPYADAVRLGAEGKIVDRVLTEKGWYIPNADRLVE